MRKVHILFWLLLMPLWLFAQQTFVPVSATIKDAHGTYTSENFDCGNMTVWDNGSSVSIALAGDKIPLKQSPYNKDTYQQSVSLQGVSLSISAHRSSGSGEIYMVTVKQSMQAGSVTITFKKRSYLQ